MIWQRWLQVVEADGGAIADQVLILSSPSNTSTILEYQDSHDLNSSNRLVRTRMPGGVAGARLTPPPMPIKRKPRRAERVLAMAVGMEELRQMYR